MAITNDLTNSKDSRIHPVLLHSGLDHIFDHKLGPSVSHVLGILKFCNVCLSDGGRCGVPATAETEEQK